MKTTTIIATSFFIIAMLVTGIILVSGCSGGFDGSSQTDIIETTPPLPKADAVILTEPSAYSFHSKYDICLTSKASFDKENYIHYPQENASFVFNGDLNTVFTRSLSLSHASTCHYGLFEKNGMYFAFFRVRILTTADAERLCHLIRCYIDYFPIAVTGSFTPSALDLIQSVCALDTVNANGHSILTANMRAEYSMPHHSLLIFFNPCKKSLDPNGKMVALTYDDGPGAYSEKILTVLEQFQVKATFYVNGSHVTDYPEIVVQTFTYGHEIGNHTNLHESFSENVPSIIRKTIEDTNEKIRALVCLGALTVRPPGGEYHDRNGNLVTLDYPIILWEIDTLDYKANNSEQILESIKINLSHGAIILMHDSQSLTADTTPLILEYLSQNQYQTVTVSELLEFAGNGSKNGYIYTSAKS